MGCFSNAQKLFADYQKNGNTQDLISSLEIVEEIIIENKDVDLQKAINLQSTIGEYINEQFESISTNANLPECSKDIKPNELISLIESALTEENAELLLELFRIRTTYYTEQGRV